jgi:hypothetical protein
MRRSSRCSSFPNRALPPLPGLSLLVRSLLELLDLPEPLGGREDELLPEDLLGGRDEDGLSDEDGLTDDEGLPDPLDGRDEDGLSDDEGLPDPLDGREELELLLGLSGLSGLSDPDCLGVLPESLTI